MRINKERYKRLVAENERLRRENDVLGLFGESIFHPTDDQAKKLYGLLIGASWHWIDEDAFNLHGLDVEDNIFFQDLWKLYASACGITAITDNGHGQVIRGSPDQSTSDEGEHQ
jgi:hypothetical protein